MEDAAQFDRDRVAGGVVSAIATCGGTVFQHFFRRTGEQIRDVTVQAKPRARQVPVTAAAQVPETFRTSARTSAYPGALGATGPVMQRNTSYASAVEGLAACFDQANGLDPARPGCPLDPGLQLTPSGSAGTVCPSCIGLQPSALSRGTTPAFKSL